MSGTEIGEKSGTDVGYAATRLSPSPVALALPSRYLPTPMRCMAICPVRTYRMRYRPTWCPVLRQYLPTLLLRAAWY
eukprot:831337-Rhodomonas_salina.2